MKVTYERPEVIEARAILRLVALGTTTLEAARELISIPPDQEAALTAFANQGGKDARAIGYAVLFRSMVLREFDRIVLDSGCDALNGGVRSLQTSIAA